MKKNFPFMQYEPGIPCSVVATHYNPHDEECAAIISLKYFGDDLHPGITEAIEQKKFLFIDAGSTVYQGKDWRYWHKKGIIFVGTMHGPYDEHYLPEDIQDHECSATLISRALNMVGGEWQKTLDCLVESDRRSEKNFLSFSSHLRRAAVLTNSYKLEDQIKLLEIGMQPFEWILKLQSRFHHETSIACKHDALVQKIKHRGNTIRVASIRSDDPQMISVARTAKGVSAHVVICQNSRGHVCITGGGRPYVDISEVSAEIKMAEMKLKGMKYNPNDPRLREKGEMLGLEEWSFQKEAQRLFNGSFSAPNKPATRIPLRQIVEIVLQTLAMERKPTTQRLGNFPAMQEIKKNFSVKA